MNFIPMLIIAALLLCASHTLAGNSIVIAQANSGQSIPTLPFPNSLFQHKIRGSHTNETFVLFEGEYLDEGPGYHLHMKDDELFHILDGQVQMIVNGSQFCASTGDYVYVPRGISQGIRVYNPKKDKKRVKIQIMLFPSGLEHFLDEIAVIFQGDRNNQTAIKYISEKYGIVDLGPVSWEDLGCFNNISTKKTLNIFLLIIVIFILE